MSLALQPHGHSFDLNEFHHDASKRNSTAMLMATNSPSVTFNGKTDIFSTQDMLETTINSIRPSIRQDVIKMYDDIRDKMEGIVRKNSFNKIGF
ncbi:MAG: hypothetical protein IKO86_06565 [Prevotella sp.]|nr:hypothetical protein [Prevotella sp.]